MLTAVNSIHMPNDTIGFRPSNRQQELITIYQQEEGDPDNPLKKSDSVSQLVDLGLARYFGGFQDAFFVELAKASMFVALTLAAVWWATGFAIPYVLATIDTFVYMMFGVSLGSLVIHYSDANPVRWLSATLRGKGDERGA